jgi:DNA-binding MarR family transcriptional regulator
VGDALRRRIRQARFESPIQEAMLNLMVAANEIRDRTERALADSGLTLPQYNVLRILRGARPEGHPRCEIAARMLDRAPDVTRILDRLEEKKLVERCRDRADRRQSVARITPRGMSLLEEVDPVLRANMAEFAERLGAADCRELSRLCELVYG